MTHTVIRSLVVSLVCVTAAFGRDESTTQALVPLVPLNDLGRDAYAGSQGGLYPHGANMLSGHDRQLALEHAARIAPLDGQGRVAPGSGRIGVVVLGAANARLVALDLIEQASADDEKSGAVVLVNGATGTSLRKMALPGDRSWTLLPAQVAAAGLEPAQVQVAWLDATGELPAYAFPFNAQAFADELAAIVRNARQALPNLKLVYLSSGANAAHADAAHAAPARGALDSYESGFAVKWLIEERLEGGASPAPWLSWGPYLWADELSPRSDGLVSSRDDFADDGLHLSARGAARVAGKLLDLLHVDAQAQGWFLAQPAAVCEEAALAWTYGVARVGPDAPSIAASTLPLLPSRDPLWIAVRGAPASTPGVFLLAFNPQNDDSAPASGPLLVSLASAHQVHVTTDAEGSAWLRLGRVATPRKQLCGDALDVQFVASSEGALIASPALRLHGGH